MTAIIAGDGAGWRRRSVRSRDLATSRPQGAAKKLEDRKGMQTLTNKSPADGEGASAGHGRVKRRVAYRLATKRPV